MSEVFEARGCRLSELLAALSMATDLGLGQPMEHVVRSCLIGLRLGEAAGLDDEQRAAICCVGLLAWVGCVADSHEVTMVFGDDLAFRADCHKVEWAGLPWAAFVLGRAGAGKSSWQRARVAATVVAGGRKGLERSIRAHCEGAGQLAGRLGLGPEVCDPLQQVFERWDGRGVPAGLEGEQVAVAARVVALASVLEVFERIGGVDAARDEARRRRGTHFDPDLVDCFLRDPHGVLSGGDPSATWEALIEAAPGLGRRLEGRDLDAALEALADFTDLKSPFTLGHSRGVADLALEAGRRLGFGPGELVVLRRAGLVHDLGHQGVSNAIWEKPSALTQAEWERVRLHPYLVERILATPGLLADLGALATLHHERLDGSGYPRGVSGASLSPAARVLAAADAYQAMTEPRPHRDARSPEAAGRELRADARAGRLDPHAVDAVLEAAGHRVGRRKPWPDGLTAREVEILVWVARGHPNRVVARRLGIAEKTVGNHVEHVYTKIGCATRAGAALYAMQHGLLADAAASQPDRTSNRGVNPS